MPTDVMSTGFSPVPSLDRSSGVTVDVSPSVPATAMVVGLPVGREGDVPRELGVDRPRLTASGFDGSVGAALVAPTKDAPTTVAVGVGDPDALDAAGLRTAAAGFAA
jgi:leucyl aminopeptidase